MEYESMEAEGPTENTLEPKPKRRQRVKKVPVVRYRKGYQKYFDQVSPNDLVQCPECGRNVYDPDLDVHLIIEHGGR